MPNALAAYNAGGRPPWRPFAKPDLIGSPEPEAITLGRYIDPETGLGPKIRYGGDQHVLVFGPNGKGKGTRLLMPNLLQMTGRRSVVVVDPKGELAAITAPWRRTLGPVVIINPFGVLTDWPGYEDLQSWGFNPLAHLDPAAHTFNSDTALLADALVKIEGKDPHWPISARILCAALIQYTVIEARQAGQVPTMARFRELLCEASAEPSMMNDFYGEGLPRRAREMMESALSGLRNKASQFTDWNKEIQSIASHAKAQTEPFDDFHIANDLSRNGYDFRNLKRQATTVYLILPPEMMERHSKWLRLVLTAAIHGVLRARRPGEMKTLFMIDEFYSLGHLEIISTVWALVRGYGIQIMPILQDLNQLKKLYPDMWETFVGMAGAVVNFAPNDTTTADWMSKRAGEHERIFTGTTITKGSSSGASGASNSNSTTLSHTSMKAPLLTPHKLHGLPPGFVTITLDGLSHIVPAYAPPYYDIKETWMRGRDNPYYQG